jgi:LTXXQ motif family protein
MGALTDARISIVKAALQLTPEQQKLWPPIEDAMSARAKNRHARLAADAQRVDELRDRGRIDALRDRDPVAFLQKRAEALSQRSTDLKKLADAWQPLYQTLTADQKRRMGFLAIYVLREMRDGDDQGAFASYDDD